MRLIIALLLTASAWAADTTLDVNTASTVGDQDCTTNTVGSTGTAACATLSQAESKIPANITAAGSNGIWTIMCSGSTDDATAVTVNGTTTDATHYIRIVGDGTPTGAWDADRYTLTNTVGALLIYDEFVRVENLQIELTGTGAGIYMMNINSVAAGATFHIANNIFKGRTGQTSYAETAMQLNDADATFYVFNNIVYVGTAASADANGINLISGTAHVYSNTVVGGYRSIRQTGGTMTAKNNYAGASGAGGAYAGTITKTTCASSDTTGTTGLTEIAYNTTNFTNVTTGSEDLRLPSGSALLNVGTDTSGESAPLNFTTDIGGETRSTWDVGADELVVASAAKRRTFLIQ
jgi:hypothetical protein